ncbi:hypothetical protein [Enterobacter oligotrophicus]|uniref:hypothetical protein n=1 Tax=Enterobacter oligotrophicus TaxID=2478464 RepID=UPI0023F3B05E|nr:hypothetical protein [Enterobacter oligotrophicus]
MKQSLLILLGVTLSFSQIAQGTLLKEECIGYYNIQLPDNLEIALYPIKGFITPPPGLKVTDILLSDDMPRME